MDKKTILEKELKDAELKIIKIKKELDREEYEDESNFTPEKKLAVALHKLLCRGNHVDDCDWYHGIKWGKHKWNSYAHNDYLQKAKALINYLPDKNTDDILKIVETICYVIYRVN